MALTQNQRQALRNALPSQRTQMANNFRLQNSNNSVVARPIVRPQYNSNQYSGNGPRRIRFRPNAISNLNRNRTVVNNRPRFRVNNRLNRNSLRNWNNSNVITVRASEQLTSMVVQSGSLKDYMIRSPINPRFQTTANRYSNIYGKFRYSKFEYRFVSIAPTTSTDSVLFSFTENNRWFLRNSTDASQGIGFHNANAAKSTPWTILINNDEPNKWYDTPQSAASNMTEANTQGWFHRVGFGGTVNHVLGFVEVRYILHLHSPIAGTDRNEANLRDFQDDPLPEFNALSLSTSEEEEAGKWLNKPLIVNDQVTSKSDNDSFEELPYEDRGELDD